MTQVAQYAAQLENYTKAIQIYEQVNYSWNSLDSVYHLYFSQLGHAYNKSLIPSWDMHTIFSSIFTNSAQLSVCLSDVPFSCNFY